MRGKAERRQATINRAKAMNHPIRRAALLYLIEHGVASPREIAFGIGEHDDSKVAYHVKKLEEYGCAELVRTEQVRGAVKHFYRRTEQHLVEGEEWEELDPDVRKSIVVEAGQPAFDDFLTALFAGTLGQDEKFSLIRYPMFGMDHEGLEEVIEIQERAFHETEKVAARAAERLERSGREPIKVSTSFQAFEVPHF